MKNTQWLTVSEASLLSSSLGLDRTPKTIRGWARNGHVEAQKKSTANGEMWILDDASLRTKIQTEIEYRDQAEAVQARANESEQSRTGADRFEPVQTGADAFGQGKAQNDQNAGVFGGANLPEPQADMRSGAAEATRVRKLESEVMRLKIDVGWRDKMLDKLGEENKTGQETLHAQARYIGHLESDLMRLGGKPDQTFLAAPTPHGRAEATRPEPVMEPEVMQTHRPHPDQQAFRPGMMG